MCVTSALDALTWTRAGSGSGGLSMEDTVTMLTPFEPDRDSSSLDILSNVSLRLSQLTVSSILLASFKMPKTSCNNTCNIN